MKRLLLLLFLASVSFVLGLVTYDSPDWHLEFILLDYRIGLNIALVLAGVLVLLALLDLVVGILRLPLRWAATRKQRQEEKVFRLFMQGLTYYARSDWNAAYQQFLRTAQHPKYQFHANLFAAYALLNMQQFSKLQTVLHNARMALDKDDLALSLAEAQILIKQKQFRRAQDLLDELQCQHPQNQHVVSLLANIKPTEPPSV